MALSRMLDPGWIVTRFSPTFTALRELQRRIPLGHLVQPDQRD